jgi:hypothetical protein
MPDGTFKAGQKVPITGIYTATHYQHRMPHEVFAVEGEQFPTCRKCGVRTRFVLAQAAAHIEADRDFAKAAAVGAKSKKVRPGHRKNH